MLYKPHNGALCHGSVADEAYGAMSTSGTLTEMYKLHNGACGSKVKVSHSLIIVGPVVNRD